MTLIPRIKWVQSGGLLILGLALTGCNRDQIKVQEVPKDAEPVAQQPAEAAAAPAMPANPHAGMDMGGAAPQPAHIKWTLPVGWQEKPTSEMRVGSFNAPGKDGQNADVSITPLPSGGPQMELAVLNMWRGELQLPSADKSDSEAVTVGAAQGKLFEIADGKAPGRILVAVLDRDGMSWYFKIKGEDAVVRDQKPAFVQFLKSISFEAAPEPVITAPPASPPGAQPSVAEAPAPAPGALPSGWKEIPNPQMLLAKYVIQGSGEAKAEVNISMLANQGGGVMANIGRWRNQLGLPPISEEDWSKQARTLDLPGGPGTLVDMTGTDMKTGKKSRLIGVIEPQAGGTWFYKLMGDEQIVEQQKDVFTKFIQTTKFSNAP